MIQKSKEKLQSVGALDPKIKAELLDDIRDVARSVLEFGVLSRESFQDIRYFANIGWKKGGLLP